jgi:pyridoxine 4-dehydrogenase
MISGMTDDMITAAAAGSWKLGNRTVHRLGFGALRLPQTGRALDPAAVPRDREQAIAVLRRAVELGVNHIDTAAFYFSPLRSANELINRALAPYPTDLVIATKVGPARDAEGHWVPGGVTAAQLRGQVEENLRQLGLDRLDLVNLRVSGPGSIAERFGALADLRAAGLIHDLGVSNVDSGQLAEARAIAPVVSVQNRYALGAPPEQHALLLECGRLGIAFVPYYSIAGPGSQGGRRAAEAEGSGVRAVAAARGVSAAQVRIAWTLHQGEHVLAIPGTGDPAHLEQNIAAGALRLSPDELARLAQD